MAIHYGKIRNLAARQIVSALSRDGFSLDRQAGSHRHYLHSDGRRVTVTYHVPSDTFTRKTLKSMVEDQAGWEEEDLTRLKLIK